MQQFQAEVFQNHYLSRGSSEVHAILTISSRDGEAGAGVERPALNQQAQNTLFGIICDVSGSMDGEKIASAREAIVKLIGLLPEQAGFFVIAGSTTAQVVFAVEQATSNAKMRAIDAVRRMAAHGGTVMSSWIEAASAQFQRFPSAIGQALLLTDGQNDHANGAILEQTLLATQGVFQCHCRGVGTDWQVGELRKIADKLLGTVDIIPNPAQIEADFRTILTQALGKSLGDVVLRLWTPLGASIKYCKEVSPNLTDLRADQGRSAGQLRYYPTGAWGGNERRDYHLCIEVLPAAIGDEVLAGRVGVLATLAGAENKLAEGRIFATWTDDEMQSARIDATVAHYTGQAELAQAIQAGLEARAQGDTARATALLGQAVKIAHQSGNEATTRLLRQVVEVQNPDDGTVRLKQGVLRADEMMLETRSTKTARVSR
jgi:hypothetical protein